MPRCIAVLALTTKNELARLLDWEVSRLLAAKDFRGVTGIYITRRHPQEADYAFG